MGAQFLELVNLFKQTQSVADSMVRASSRNGKKYVQNETHQIFHFIFAQIKSLLFCMC